MRSGSVRAGLLTILLDLGALTLCLQPATVRAAGATGWTAGRRGRDGVAKQYGETLPCRGSIASLGAVLGGADREHRAGQPGNESLEREFPLSLGQRCRGCDVEPELHA